MIQKLSILGSTGSIGTQTIEVCRELGITITALSCGRNVERLKDQIALCQPRLVSVTEEGDAKKLDAWIRSQGFDTEVMWGQEGNLAVAGDPDAEMVVAAMVGMAGLGPVIHALETQHDIALANKETLVVAGDLVMALAKKNQLRIHPVDSEHSAIWQCLAGTQHAAQEVDHILLTASGGPFRGKRIQDLQSVTAKEALNHPTWKMGGKISIDSATLMNKGLELIEAVHLFNLNPDQVKVVVHPESIVHSAVAFRDGAILAQLSQPDMKLPIRFAITYPERTDRVDLEFWNPLQNGGQTLYFEAPDEDTFRTLALCRDAIRQGGGAPIILNAVNEVAVQAFLDGDLSFLGIQDTVAYALDELSGEVKCPIDSLDTIKEIEQAARDFGHRAIY